VTNLLAETLAVFAQHGRTPDEIAFIGSRHTGHSCTWEEYQALADVKYDSGYGSVEVAEDLEIVFNDGATMERGEYDGSEWWSYRAPFVPPTETHQITGLVRSEYGWESTLAGIAKDMEKAD
jgi:hypothetical protein